MSTGLSNAIIFMSLGAVASLIATIILCLTVVPDKKRDSLKGFGRFLNDLFNFRGLLMEAIIKTLYVLITVTFVVGGFFMLFIVNTHESIFTGETTTVWYGWVGLIAMIVGPIATRLVFEGMMLFILLVKNSIQINNKLKDQYKTDEVSKKEKKQSKQAPIAQVPVQPDAEMQTSTEAKE
ncbi:MAG: hypothetical protein IKU48_04975 [Clostridia bacterium]|nr:hypothetical protein [Clostridia bacterium]